jgi:Lar family restriction alleviation protein
MAEKQTIVALGNPLPCPFCGAKAELSEWEEVDAKRWAARVACNHCDAKGSAGYADNWRGCFDAVNDLHKDRAISAWNRRAAAPQAPRYVGIPSMEWIDTFLRNVCELPDRNSPEGEPDAIVATLKELRECALNASSDALGDNVGDESHHSHLHGGSL